jgi:outer membrane lipoprotein-sorting protein
MAGFAVLPGKTAVWTPASAQAAFVMNEEHRAVIQELNAFLNGIQTMSGEFTQVSPRGQIANGVFYISKPGKMRFEYAPPSPLIVVSDGSWVTVRNTERERDDQYPLSATPLNLVLSDNVNLFEQAEVLSIEAENDLAAVTMQEKNQLVAGQLTMIFDRASNQLLSWIIVDGKGQRTSVELSNVDLQANLDPSLFRVKRPKERKSAKDQ